MEGLRFSSATAMLCSISAMIVCAFGLFRKSCWLNVKDNQTTYGIFTVVNCSEYLCTLDTDGTAGWIVFTQTAALLQFILLIAAILFQIGKFMRNNPIIVIAASGALGLSCGFSVLHMCVLTQEYSKLTHGYMTTQIRPANYVIYQTLPLGLCLTSGSLCIPAFVCLVIYRTEERNLRLQKPDAIV